MNTNERDKALSQLARESAPDAPAADKAFLDLRDRIAERDQQPVSSNKPWLLALSGVASLAVVALALFTMLSTDKEEQMLVGNHNAEPVQSVIEEVYVYYDTAGILINIDEESGWAVIDAQEI